MTAAEVITTIVTFLQSAFNLVGIGVIVFGAFQVMESFASSNPESRSGGIKVLVSGIGIMVVGNTLVPLISNFANF